MRLKSSLQTKRPAHNETTATVSCAAQFLLMADRATLCFVTPSAWDQCGHCTHSGAINPPQKGGAALMQDMWRSARIPQGITRSECFLSLNEENILTHAGNISHELVLAYAGQEYEKFHEQHQCESRGLESVLINL